MARRNRRRKDAFWDCIRIRITLGEVMNDLVGIAR